MNVPGAAPMARYFAKLDLRLWCDSSFDRDGVRDARWFLTDATPHDVYEVDGRRQHSSLSDLWHAWLMMQPVLHLRRFRAREAVLRYLDGDPREVAAFDLWLARAGQWTPDADTDLRAWPWTSAWRSSDGDLGTFGPPWSTPPSEALVRRCVQLGTGNGWARRGLIAGRFDHQRCDVFMEATKALVAAEEAARMRARLRRFGGARPRRPALRL